MRLYSCDEQTDKFRKLEDEPDSFPFLIYDQTNAISENTNPFDQQIILFRFSNYEKCQHLTKPIQLPKKFSPLTVYKVIFDICVKSCKLSAAKFKDESEFLLKSFEEHFGTKENPLLFKAFPFVIELRNSSQSLATDVYKEEDIELEEYHEIVVHLRHADLKSLKNFNSQLSISSVNIRAPEVKLTLQQCLKSFTSVEKLDKENEWFCSKCKEHKQAEKKLSLCHLPKILIIHLKRFTKSKYSYSKNTSFVDAPLHDLDLSEFMMENLQSKKYDLFGVINHMGGMGGGHYTAYVKTPAMENTWVEFDDSDVSKTDKNGVISASSYVLFYRRKE